MWEESLKASKSSENPLSLWNLGRVEFLFEKSRRSDVQHGRAECSSKPFVTTSTIHVTWQLQFKMIPKWITEVNRGYRNIFLCATEAKTAKPFSLIHISLLMMEDFFIESDHFKNEVNEVREKYKLRTRTSYVKVSWRTPDNIVSTLFYNETF